MRRRLSWLMALRAVVVTLLLGSTVVVNLRHIAALTTPANLILYGLIVFTYALTIVYALMLPRVRNLVLFTYFQLAGDLVLATGLVYVTGGVDSIFLFLYSLTVINGSMLVGRRGALMTAAMSCIAFGLLLTGQFYGILPADPLLPGASFDIGFGKLIYSLFINFTAVLLIALLSSSLAEQLRRAGQRIERQEINLTELQAEVDRSKRLATVGELSAGIAHEIRNPLASISGAIQLLQGRVRRREGGEEGRLMDIVIRETDRLDALVSNFLSFARPQPPRRVRADISRIVSETLSVFSHSGAVNGKVEIESDLQPRLEVDVDLDQIKQVLWNLLNNAAQAMDGGGSITVRTARVDAKDPKERARSYVTIEVCDQGRGIEEEDLDKIFDPFFTTKEDGTGLGLSTLHSIVEAHGGRVRVGSRLGEGSRFMVMLPE